MAQNNLPEIIGTVGELMNFNNGNVFNRDFLFPRKAEKRLEAQKEILLKIIDAQKETKLAEIDAQKEITLAQLKYFYDNKQLRNEIICQYIQCLQYIPECDLDKINNFLSSIL